MPTDWPKHELRELVVPGSGLQTGPFGSQLHAAEYSEAGIPVVMPKDIVAGVLSPKSVARIPPALAESTKLRKHALKPGDIIFGRRGDIGRCGLVEEHHTGWLCGTGCLRARPHKGVNSAFLIHRLQHSEAVQWLNENAVGQTMLNLNTKILGALPLTLPPLPEQRKIAEILSSVDEAIQATQAVIEQTRRVKEGLLQELLTKGIGHTRFKKTAIGEIPESWDLRQLRQVATFQAGYAFKSADFAEQGDRLVRGSNVGVGQLEWEDNKTKFYPRHRRDEVVDYLLREGDIIIAMDRPFITAGFKVARAGTSDLPALLLQRVGRFHETTLNMDFLWTLIESDFVEGHLKRLQKGTDLPHISQKEIEDCFVPVPPRAEQDEIASQTLRASAAIHESLEYLPVLERVKAGLLQDLLTGKVRVSV